MVHRTATAQPAPPIAAWIGFSAMCIGMFMAILDIQIVATSLPSIQEALGIRPDQMSWIQTSYLIAEVIAIPLTGWLTRVLSLRGLFVIFTAAFVIASAACASSTGFASLVAARIVQGFAGGVLIPIVFSAGFLLFPGRGQALATTIAGVLAVLAPTIGPIAGGWITSTYSWHWLFLINVVPGILAALVGFSALPRSEPQLHEARHLDFASLVLVAAALAALEIGLKEAPGQGWGSGLVLGLLLLALACGAAFVRRTLACAKPIVDLRLLADRNFALGCALSFILGMGLYGSVYLMPVFLAYVRYHGALATGEIMLVTGAAQLVSAPIVVWLEQRVAARHLAIVGFALFALGLAMSAFDTPRTDGEDMFWPQAVRGLAIMLCLLPPIRIALGHLPIERMPDASALFNLMRNLGGAIGLALIDTVIFGRAEMHGRALADRLARGDAAALDFVGLPSLPVPIQIIPEKMQLVHRAVERAALTMAINEAWTMISILTAAGAFLAWAASKGSNHPDAGLPSPDAAGPTSARRTRQPMPRQPRPKRVGSQSEDEHTQHTRKCEPSAQ
jgi:DHA2 family multidrug resistance protein